MSQPSPDHVPATRYGAERGIPKASVSRLLAAGMPHVPGTDIHGRWVNWVLPELADHWLGDPGRSPVAVVQPHRNRRPAFMSTPRFRAALIEALKDPAVRREIANALADAGGGA